MRRGFYGLLFICLVAAGCFRRSPETRDTHLIPSHQLFDSLLQLYVDDRGWVAYDSFQVHRNLLNAYLDTLSHHPPGSSWAQEDRIAYWINAYNAFTIELVLQHKQPASIKDIGSAISVPFVNTPWQIDFIKIGDEVFNLDDIEHGILRREFDEPRVHFALVCASRSCPPLRREVYQGDKLDEQLTSQAEIFLADTLRNKVEHTHVKLSKLFQWYAGDFTAHATLLEYVNQYAPVLIYDEATVEYLDYDWRLNKQ
ncbi:MAG: DUF547 domain-containing protein [Bacteroidia bacterium]|nr:DUF547 domain-containing protein [Bacteroidia bacterium]